MRHPLSTELVIVGGPQLGARMALPSGQHRVGSSLSSDVVVLDPSMADAHFEIDIAANGAATLRALSAVSLGTRPRLLEAGGSRSVRSSLRFDAGATCFRLSSTRMAGSHHLSRGVATVAAALCFCLASVFVVSRTDSATLQRLPHVAEVAPARTLPDPLLLTHARLRGAGLDGLALTRGADGALTLTGTVSPSQVAAVRDLQFWFDGQFGTRALLVDRVVVGGAPPSLSVRAAWTGSEPYVIDGSGERLLLGARLPGGWVLSAIAPDALLLRQGGRAVTVRY